MAITLFRVLLMPLITFFCVILSPPWRWPRQNLIATAACECGGSLWAIRSAASAGVAMEMPRLIVSQVKPLLPQAAEHCSPLPRDMGCLERWLLRSERGPGAGRLERDPCTRVVELLGATEMSRRPTSANGGVWSFKIWQVWCTMKYSIAIN